MSKLNHFMSNLEITWKIIREKNFQLIDPLNKDFICMICKEIMINASKAPCGCRYCYQCIKAYLSKTVDNYCPGSSSHCGINWIDLDRDICIDNLINIRISQITTKCPMETCEFTGELSMMENHLKHCDRKFIGCPYYEIGCLKSEIRKNEVNTHLLNESFPHQKLLIDYVNKLRNEIKSLNKKISTVKSENVSLIESLKEDRKNFKFQELAFNKDIYKLSEENNTMKIQINSLNYKMTALKEKEKQEQKQIEENLKLLKEKQENIEESVNKLHEANVATNGTVDLLTNSINSLKENLDTLDEETDDVIDDVAKMKKVVNKIKKSTGSCEVKIKNIQLQLDKQNAKEFIWKIEDISEVIKTYSTKRVCSDSFFVSENSYKMCLYVYPNGLGKSKGFFGVYFNITRGPYDDILCWPCEIDVTLELLDQETKLNSISKTKKFESNSNHSVYKKPTTDQNDGLGYPFFIKLDNLLKQTQIIKDNQLFIKCLVCF